MWENSEVSSSFCSFDLSFNLNNDTNNDDESNKIFNNDYINSCENLSYIETMQSIFPSVDHPSLFNDDLLIHRKEVSTQSSSNVNQDEFDLIGSTSRDNEYKLNDFYVNTTNINNQNNGCVNKNSNKRGRGRGSRGSYKPRGGNRSRLVNNQTINPSSLLSFTSPLSTPPNPFNNNNSSNSCSTSSYISTPSLSSNSQKVCINPEILRRLGYSNTNNSTDSSLSMPLNINNNHHHNTTQNIQYNLEWSGYSSNTNTTNNQFYDQFTNYNKQIFNQSYPDQNPSNFYEISNGNFINNNNNSNDYRSTLNENDFNIRNGDFFLYNVNLSQNLGNNESYYENEINNDMINKSFLDISHPNMHHMVQVESDCTNRCDQFENIESSLDNLFTSNVITDYVTETQDKIEPQVKNENIECTQHSEKLDESSLFL